MVHKALGISSFGFGEKPQNFLRTQYHLTTAANGTVPAGRAGQPCTQGTPVARSLCIVEGVRDQLLGDLSPVNGIRCPDA
jgi:hypothetical protein